jgi:hypothetical protein
MASGLLRDRIRDYSSGVLSCREEHDDVVVVVILDVMSALRPTHLSGVDKWRRPSRRGDCNGSGFA